MSEYWNQYIKDKKFPEKIGTYLVLLEKYNGIRRRECDMWCASEKENFHDWMVWGDRHLCRNDWRVIGWGELPNANIKFDEEYPWPQDYLDFVEKEWGVNGEKTLY